MIFVNLIELRNVKWNFKKVSFNCALESRVFMGPGSVRKTNESQSKGKLRMDNVISLNKFTLNGFNMAAILL